MDLRRLRYFVAVAEELHFTRAAERLGIRQPPLSAQIRLLERELGTRLFLRQARGVKLTDAGALLLEQARDVLERLERAKIMVQRRARGETGAIVIGFGDGTFLAPAVPAVALAFRDRYPEVIARLEQSSTSSLVEAILDGRVDVAFIRPPIADPALFRLVPIVEEDMVVALPAQHRLRDANVVDLASLSKETFCLPRRSLCPGLHDAIIAAIQGAGLSGHIGQEAGSVETLPSIVAAGLGVSFVPESLSRLHVEGVVYRPLAGTKLRAPIALVGRAMDPLPVVRNMLVVARNWVSRREGAAGIGAHAARGERPGSDGTAARQHAPKSPRS